MVSAITHAWKMGHATDRQERIGASLAQTQPGTAQIA
jgi:hypothetical protein